MEVGGDRKVSQLTSDIKREEEQKGRKPLREGQVFEEPISGNSLFNTPTVKRDKRQVVSGGKDGYMEVGVRGKDEMKRST